MIGYAAVHIEEQGTPAIPANLAAWDALTAVGYTDREAGAAITFKNETVTVKPGNMAGAAAAYDIEGGVEVEFTLQEMTMENLAIALGLPASDIETDATDDVKSLRFPRAVGAAQKYNVMFKRLMPGTAYYERYCLHTAYVVSAEAINLKAREGTMVKVKMEGLISEEAGDWYNKSVARIHDIAGA